MSKSIHEKRWHGQIPRELLFEIFPEKRAEYEAREKGELETKLPNDIKEIKRRDANRDKEAKTKFAQPDHEERPATPEYKRKLKVDHDLKLITKPKNCSSLLDDLEQALDKKEDELEKWEDLYTHEPYGEEIDVYEKTMKAVDNDDQHTLRDLYKMGNINSFDQEWKETPLIRACRKAHPRSVEELLLQGADPNQRSVVGNSPIHYLWNDLLSSNEKKINRVKCKSWIQNCVELLLKKGANPNAQRTDGWAALHLSACFDQFETALLLLQYGADTTLICRDGRSALDIAIAHSSNKTGRLISAWPSIRNESDLKRFRTEWRDYLKNQNRKDHKDESLQEMLEMFRNREAMLFSSSKTDSEVVVKDDLASGEVFFEKTRDWVRPNVQNDEFAAQKRRMSQMIQQDALQSFLAASYESKLGSHEDNKRKWLQIQNQLDRDEQIRRRSSILTQLAKRFDEPDGHLQTKLDVRKRLEEHRKRQKYVLNLFKKKTEGGDSSAERRALEMVDFPRKCRDRRREAALSIVSDGNPRTNIQNILGKTSEFSQRRAVDSALLRGSRFKKPEMSIAERQEIVNAAEKGMMPAMIVGAVDPTEDMTKNKEIVQFTISKADVQKDLPSHLQNQWDVNEKRFLPPTVIAPISQKLDENTILHTSVQNG